MTRQAVPSSTAISLRRQAFDDHIDGEGVPNRP